MKTLFKRILYVFLFGSLFLSCTKEEELAPVAPESATATLNTGGGENPCPENCVTEELRKTVGQQQAVGTVRVCQTGPNEITITFTSTVGGFAQTGYGLFELDPDEINPGRQYLVEKESTHGDRPSTVTYTVDLTSYNFGTEPFSIATWAVVPGVGGQVWAGEEETERGNPNSRYFNFALVECEKPECPKIPCLYPKEYWCKPDVKWPCATIKVGAYNYTQDEVRAIFAATGESDAKEAFGQAVALQLNLALYPHLKDILHNIGDPKHPCYKPDDPCHKVLKHLKCILDYFDKCKEKATPKNICDPYKFPPSEEIKKAAYYIKKCLKEHACK